MLKHLLDHPIAAYMYKIKTKAHQGKESALMEKITNYMVFGQCNIRGGKGLDKLSKVEDLYKRKNY